MSLFFVILFALLIPALTVLFIWFLLLPLPKSSNKTFLMVLAILGLIICEALFILSARVPAGADNLIQNGIAQIEEHINQINPDYIHKELPTEDVQKVLSDTKMLDAYVEDSPEAGVVVRLIGAKAFISYVSSFSESIDRNINEMKEEGTEITIHNVFERIHNQSKAPILKAAKVLEITVLIITAIFLLALLIVYVYIKKNASYLDNPRVTVIEQSDEIETGHNRPRGE